MKAVLLAAGEGVRLLPITATRPKHLIQIGGKPILKHCLEALKANGVTEVLIVTHYMGEAIRGFFGDGSKFGFKIEYVEQQEVLGTGNAASLAETFVSEEFLLVYGDLLFSSEAVKTVLKTYKSQKPAAVMAVVAVDKPESYGIIELAQDKTVKRIVEKPKREAAPSNLANAGLFVFDKYVFDILRKIKRSVRKEWELTDAVTLIAKEGKQVLSAEIAKGDWFDVGRPWDLLDANEWALRRMEPKVLGNVEQGAHLIGPVSVAQTARLRSGAYIEGPCFIDEGADVGPNCFIRPCTSVGKNARVGNGCEVKNALIMDGTHVGHLSYIGDSVLGEKCNLGAGTITANLRFDNGSVKMQIKDKVVDTGRRKLGAILGDNVKTGVGVLLMPGVKVGNDSWVGAGLLVDRDVPANTKQLPKQVEGKQETKSRNKK
jgi:UDP-N-acetylglucosamine diphosphorylase / glucose-1-phosphate thymidylyltransferase / UDP-N-acetylgalactosamine diphosphorylase / glucosamine-1-phosphate N-acetyltransferase / galactosamine-1-phosphate N-acetyltransferase